jgi:hypothetical protein
MSGIVTISAVAALARRSPPAGSLHAIDHFFLMLSTGSRPVAEAPAGKWMRPRLRHASQLCQTGAMLVRLAIVMALWLSGTLLPAQEERLHFGAEWRLVRAGEVELVREGERQTGMTLRTIGLVGKLYRVNNTYGAAFDPGWCALTLNMDAQEGKRHRVTQVTYDRDRRRVSYIERDVLKGEVVSQNEMETPECVHEVTGALQRLRSLRPEPGTTVELPLSDGKKMISARVDALKREKLKLPLGEFETIKYEAHLFNGVFYRRKGRLFVWLTDDAERLPVQIRVQLPFYIGTVTIRLEKSGS